MAVARPVRAGLPDRGPARSATSCWGAWILSLLLPPIAIGAAITRYRLYDIDRILSNAIAYGLVSFVLVSTFYLANLLLVSWLSPLVEFEGLAVAGSTLLVASLFAPVRARAQASVDRRFHRAHYDAERMVSSSPLPASEMRSTSPGCRVTSSTSWTGASNPTGRRYG